MGLAKARTLTRKCRRMRRFVDSPIRVDDERQTFVRSHIKGTAVYTKECEDAKSARFTALGAGVRAWHESARNHSHPAAATATEAAQRAGRRIGQPSFAGGGPSLWQEQPTN